MLIEAKALCYSFTFSMKQWYVEYKLCLACTGQRLRSSNKETHLRFFRNSRLHIILPASRSTDELGAASRTRAHAYLTVRAPNTINSSRRVKVINRVLFELRARVTKVFPVSATTLAVIHRADTEVVKEFPATTFSITMRVIRPMADLSNIHVRALSGHIKSSATTSVTTSVLIIGDFLHQTLAHEHRDLLPVVSMSRVGSCARLLITVPHPECVHLKRATDFVRHKDRRVGKERSATMVIVRRRRPVRKAVFRSFSVKEVDGRILSSIRHNINRRIWGLRTVADDYQLLFVAVAP